VGRAEGRKTERMETRKNGKKEQRNKFKNGKM
jgi:hypothetical protein